MGKFARLAVGTRHIDYNGRLCMVAAGTANKKAFGIDRAANPWADIAATDLVMVLGSNVSECSPITTDRIIAAIIETRPLNNTVIIIATNGMKTISGCAG